MTRVDQLLALMVLAARAVNDAARHRAGVGAAGEDAATVDPDIAGAGREVMLVGDGIKISYALHPESIDVDYNRDESCRIVKNRGVSPWSRSIDPLKS